MSILERINNQAVQMSANAKLGVQSLLLSICKLCSGAIIGLTFALIGQEIWQLGPILFWFVILSVTAAFYKISKQWTSIGLLIFDLLAILAALLIRMYVVVAPG